MKNTINNPLKLSWKEQEWQYKVNKPLDQSGEYVDKAIANDLVVALQKCLNEFNFSNSQWLLKEVDSVIRNATQS
jgi:uncharacterized protein YcgI (DUF1989 family)